VKLIAGLGNPGRAYADTRHNAGYRVVNRFCDHHRVRLWRPRFNARVGTGRISQEKVIIIKPRTFMNLSGKAVAPALRHYGISLSELIVIHDDLDIPLGSIRFSRKGGDGGHRGLRSIIEELGSSEFVRLRIGIGRPEDDTDAADYVLSPPEEDERERFEEAIQLASQALDVMLVQGLDAAMNRYHRSR
jgi:PTH1 family peptidyl-tRNA hydrolase